MLNKELPDEILIKNVKDKLCSESLVALCNKYNKIYFDVCAKYAKKVPQLDYNELIKDDLFVLNRAIQTYKNDRKAKFTTWFSHMSRYHCLNSIKSAIFNTKAKISDFNEEIWNSILNSEKNSYRDDNSFIHEFISKTLSKLRDKRILKIYEMRYLKDTKEWKDIAKEFELTTTHVKFLHDIGRNFLKEEMEKENAAK